MTVNFEKKDGTLTVAPVGRLDSVTSDELSSFVEENFTDDVKTLIFDLGSVDFISSKGIRTLVVAYKSSRGREIKVINPNPSVREIFRMSGLMKIFGIA